MEILICTKYPNILKSSTYGTRVLLYSRNILTVVNFLIDQGLRMFSYFFSYLNCRLHSYEFCHLSRFTKSRTSVTSVKNILKEFSDFLKVKVLKKMVPQIFMLRGGFHRALV